MLVDTVPPTEKEYGQVLRRTVATSDRRGGGEVVPTRSHGRAEQSPVDNTRVGLKLQPWGLFLGVGDVKLLAADVQAADGNCIFCRPS